MQKLSYAIKPRLSSLILKNGYKPDIIKATTTPYKNKGFSFLNKRHNNDQLYFSTQTTTTNNIEKVTTTTTNITNNIDNNNNNNNNKVINPAVLEYRQSIASANTFLNNNKKSLDNNITHQLWHQYKVVVQDQGSVNDLTREDFTLLRSILWKNKIWGSEDRILEILEDMKRSGHEWSFLEYNEYFLVKLYQAKYQDILNTYEQAYHHDHPSKKDGKENENEEKLRLSIGSFNAILATFIKLEQEEKAALFIKQAYTEWDIIPDIRDFGRTMHRSIPKDNQVIDIGKQWITKYGMVNTKIINTNLQHLLREKSLDDVLWLYDTLKQQQQHLFDSNTFSLLIRHTMDANKLQLCISIYQEMKQLKIKPNQITCSSMLSLYAHRRQVDKAEQVVKDMILAGYPMDEVIYNQLIKVYFKARYNHKALQAFEEIQQNPNLQINEVILNTMIDGLVMNRELKAANHLYLQLLSKSNYQQQQQQQQQVNNKSKKKSSNNTSGIIRPDIVTFNTLFKGYMEQKDYLSAMGIIKDMYRYQCEPDTVTFTTMISSLFEQNPPKTTSELLTTLKKSFGMKPNIYTFNAIINEWVKHDNIQEMEKTFNLLQSSEYQLQPTIHTFTNMMQGYNSDTSMNLTKIMTTFQTMVGYGIKPDRASYHFLISGFIYHQRLQDALTCLLRMRQSQINPTKDTWTLLMDECIKKNQWDLGKTLVKEIESAGFSITSPSLRKKYLMLKNHM